MKKKQKKSRKKKKHIGRKFLTISLALIVLGASAFLGFRFWLKPTPQKPQTEKRQQITLSLLEEAMVKNVNRNYAVAIDSCAKKFNISAQYLKALACLECGGKIGNENLTRFEPTVYKRLKKLQKGEIKSFEGISQQTIHNATDEALRNLATSWGPFQIMGYKCLHLGINVIDLRGKNSVYWGVKWISMEYGRLLKKERYRDAFHYHNAGCVFPKNGKSKTFHKDYPDKGVKYMTYF